MSKTHLVKRVTDTKFYSRKPTVDKGWIGTVDSNLSVLNTIVMVAFVWRVCGLCLQIIKYWRRQDESNA